MEKSTSINGGAGGPYAAAFVAVARSETAKGVGAQIRRLRRAQGRTIEETAAAAGVNANYLGSVERGAQAPSVDVLARIARALAIDLAVLVDVRDQLPHAAVRKAITDRLSRMSLEQLRTVLRLLDAVRM